MAKLVLDTNSLLQCISRRSRYHDLWISLLLAITCIVALTGCSHKKQPAEIDNDAFFESEGITRADSIVSEISDARDMPRMHAAIDSLEKIGELSLAKTIFYRTIGYNMMGQQSASLPLYQQLAKINVNDLSTQSDLEAYVYSYNNYLRLLCDMRRYDRALREAREADRKLKSIGYNSFATHHDIAQIMGECYLYTDHVDSAAYNFQKALKGVRDRLDNFKDPLDLRECQKTMNAIARAYIHTGRYREAEPWMQIQDSLYVAADKHPKRDSVFIDEMKAEISYSKALLAHAQGRSNDAEQAFSDYLSTNTAKQLESIINGNEYLMLTHRYSEAAKNYELLDKFLKSGGYKANLENIGRFILPKYRANLMAGNKDSALRAASLVAEYYDSALIRQRIIYADLLTAVYDTEGKERQIAEQRAELSHQRLIALIIIMAIFITFVTVYIVQHRKAYKKLNESNRQLVLANERAEESSRMKTKFIQEISHEVRTPLNIISGFSQVLANWDIEINYDELQDICHKIADNSERITHLVSKFLDLSMVYSNVDIDCRNAAAPADVAQQAIEESGIQKADHLDFKLKVSSEAESLSFVTNKVMAVKALNQLLDNAIRYTQPQTVKTGEKAHVVLSIDVKGQQVVFNLEDTGIGIPPEHAENIFLEFVQLDEYSNGTGIGLTIARTLVRRMGGDIILDTSYTDGARFVMTLPAKRDFLNNKNS
ncbi:MAG: HAMP domain-containing histidine kinase [Prevotella sp.]|nr:HAMP domain-containing histidine kinase [Prevotella sp.]